MPFRGIYLAKLALVGTAYYGSAKLGLHYAFETSSVTAVWPPTGIALAAVLLWGPGMWPGIAAGALLANSWTGIPVVSTLGITCGNTLEALVGAYLLTQVAGFRPSLERPRDVLALVFVAGGLSTMVSATIGVLSLVVGDEVAFGDFPRVWRTWWLGDMGGDILVAPVLLILATRRPPVRGGGRPLEAAALTVVLVGAGLLIFSQPRNLAYLVFPPLIWASVRFGQPGAAAASLAVAAIAVAFAADGQGPFLGGNPDETLLLAQSFVAVAGMTVLLLAAVITQRRLAEEAVEHVAQTLQAGLLPARLPEIPGVETASWFRPAGRRNQVGGDFYDVCELGDGAWSVVVGDVCGKGPEAAALTGLARHTLRAAAVYERRPSRLLTLLNDAILDQRSEETFCTAAFVRVDLMPGESRVRLTFSIGGHPLPMMLHASGRVEEVGRPGTLLGMDPRPMLSDYTVEMRSGDALLLYTDGLTDAYAPERMLGPDDLAGLLERCAGSPAAQIAERVHAFALGSHASEPRDDIALVVLRVREQPDAATAGEVDLRIALKSSPSAPSAAREAVQGLQSEIGNDLLRDVELLISEVVTNSVRHAAAPEGSAIDLRVRVSPDRIRVDVCDEGHGFGPRRGPSPDWPGGWGLRIVERVADRWGIDTDGRTAVWFELDRWPTGVSGPRSTPCG